MFEITETRTVVVKAADPLTAQRIAAKAFELNADVSEDRAMVIEGPRFVDGRIRERARETAVRSESARDEIRRIRIK